ncbi:MAG: type 4a pilus biogenesis protein PilO [Bdellovibrionales bacterium]|nr:type 4a pilus biogenesis protein PilO [Bdellovibrionales bacterium]
MASGARSEIQDQLANLKSYYARLTDRERMIFMGVFAGGVIFVLILIYSIFLASNASIKEEIRKSRKSYNDILALSKEYKAMQSTVQDIDQLILRTPKNFSLATELESLAKQNGIQIDSVKERKGPPHEFYVENQVVVGLKEVGLKSVVDFLYDVENSRKLMRVSSLEIRRNFKTPQLLNVNFIVSTFQGL